jgi:hypothetical protein
LLLKLLLFTPPEAASEALGGAFIFRTFHDDGNVSPDESGKDNVKIKRQMEPQACEATT